MFCDTILHYTSEGRTIFLCAMSIEPSIEYCARASIEEVRYPHYIDENVINVFTMHVQGGYKE